MFYPVEYNQFQQQYPIETLPESSSGQRQRQHRRNQVEPQGQIAFIDPQQYLLLQQQQQQNNTLQHAMVQNPQVPMMAAPIASLSSGMGFGPDNYNFIHRESPSLLKHGSSNPMLTDANDEPILLSESRLKQLQERLKRGSLVLQNHHIRLPKHPLSAERTHKTIKKIMGKCQECRDDLIKAKKRTPRKKYIFRAMFFIISAIMYFALQDAVIDFVLRSQLQLNPNNLFYSIAWVEPPISFFAELYLYELRNSKQFLQGSRANVKEIGPFTFKMGRERRVLEWTDDTVKFMEKLTAEFDQSRSKYSIETSMTVLNTPIVATISWAYYWMEKFMLKFLNPVVHNVLTVTLQAFGERLVEERTAKEILLGRPVNLLRFLDSLAAPLKAVNVPIPDYISLFTSYGNYKLSNMSFSIIGLIAGMEFGPIEFYRQEKNGHKANQARGSHGSTEYGSYKPPCNQIVGIDPLVFGLHDQGETFDIFQIHFCRSIRFHRETTEYVEGVRAVRYKADEDMFSMRPTENRCYCHGDRTLTECDGYTDISACFGGLPIGLTHPHFLGSARLQTQVLGLEPDPEKHLSSIDIEPFSGLIYKASLGLQYNLILRNFPSLGQLGSIRPCLLPFFTISLKLKVDGILGYLMIGESFALTYGKYLTSLGMLTLAMYYFYRASTYP